MQSTIENRNNEIEYLKNKHRSKKDMKKIERLEALLKNKIELLLEALKNKGSGDVTVAQRHKIMF